MSFLQEIWTLEWRVLPILVSLVLFETPAIIRRSRRFLYVPIYFAVFPLNSLDRDLASLFGEDEMYGTAITDRPLDPASLRKRIVAISVISMAVSAFLTPLLVGFLVSFYLSPVTFEQFVVALVLLKAYLLFRSLVDFHLTRIGSLWRRRFLFVIYVGYLGVIAECLRKAYYWALPYVERGAWADLVSQLTSLIFGRVLVEFIILALLTAIFVSLITDQDLRHE